MVERFDRQEHPIGRGAEPPNPNRPIEAFTIGCACLLWLQLGLSVLVLAAEAAWVGPRAATFALPLSLLAVIGWHVATSRCLRGSVRDPLIPAVVVIMFGALGCTFGAVLLSCMHRGRPVDLFYYEGGGGPWTRLLGIVCALLGLGLLAGGAWLWANRGAYQRWWEWRNAVRDEGRESN